LRDLTKVQMFQYIVTLFFVFVFVFACFGFWTWSLMGVGCEMDG
jgi:hypothetical protein